MSLKMSKQATLELLTSNAAKYQKSHSRKAKGKLLKQLMELTAYKSSKALFNTIHACEDASEQRREGCYPNCNLATSKLN